MAARHVNHHQHKPRHAKSGNIVAGDDNASLPLYRCMQVAYSIHAMVQLLGHELLIDFARAYRPLPFRLIRSHLCRSFRCPPPCTFAPVA